MDKEIEPQPRRKLTYRVVLLIAVTATCILANLFAIAARHGYFRLWKSLPQLPSSAVYILDADENNIWVQTVDGNLHTFQLYCGSQDCNQWSQIDDLVGVTPFQCAPIQRESTCKSLESGFLQSNPRTGEVKECVAINGCFPKATETRFALMVDGTVKYWHHQNGLLVPYFDLALSTLVLPYVVAIIVSVLYSKGRRNMG